MSIINLAFAALSFILLFGYFQLARKYQILDYPNHRSSHTNPIIRGAGVIFPISFFLYNSYASFPIVYVSIGLLIISIVSFIDDLKTISSKTRFIFQLFAVVFLVYQLYLLIPIHWIFYMPLVIFMVGVVNAFNFMDGINGITGLYSLTAIATLYFLRSYFLEIVDSLFFEWMIISIIIFLFFNFRKSAVCFCGDIGSISLAFIILFFVAYLVFKTQNFKYALFLYIYGLDTGYTILYRMLKGEKVLEAHRLHFFQLLVHNYKMPHLWVSIFYALSQLALNCWLINSDSHHLLFYIPFIFIYILMEIFRYKINHSIFRYER